MARREIEFRESLLAHQGALDQLRRRLANDDAKRDEPSVRRLARSLKLCARDQGRIEIERAAFGLEGADPAAIEQQLDEVLDLLRVAVSAPVRQPVRLLVVESDPTAAKIFQSALASVHREVTLATDAAGAERLLARHRFGTILLGLDLPDMDGRDLLARVRNKARTANVPVFVLASPLESSTAAECLALGADRCFETPVDPHLLAAEVNARMQVSHETEGRTLLDPLTGLANVGGFTEAFERLAAFCRRSGNALSLGMIELVGLREINDRDGDEAGDACLVHAGMVIRDSLRQSDLVARWDGDAFVVLFPNTRLDGAKVALGKIRERLRESIAEMPAEIGGELDISAGIADAGEISRAGDAVTAAETVLQRARRDGPGTILSAGDPTRPDSNIVLLVEDDPISAAVIRHRLTRDGFDVRHFGDGEEALEAAPELDAVLAILDVKLPGMDGFELLRRMRAMDRFANVPIAIVSALGREEDVVRGLELGADDYIPKPFSTTELRARVQGMLRKRGIDLPEASEVAAAKCG